MVLASGRAESFLCAPEFWCAPGPLRRHPRFAFPLFFSTTLLYCGLSYRRLFIGRLPSLQSTKPALLLKQSASEGFGRTESHSWQGSHVAAAGWSRVVACWTFFPLLSFHLTILHLLLCLVNHTQDCFLSERWASLKLWLVLRLSRHFLFRNLILCLTKAYRPLKWSFNRYFVALNLHFLIIQNVCEYYTHEMRLISAFLVNKGRLFHPKCQ